jgi:hypothetical protein
VLVPVDAPCPRGFLFMPAGVIHPLLLHPHFDTSR